jgi:hypothetical protein
MSHLEALTRAKEVQLMGEGLMGVAICGYSGSYVTETKQLLSGFFVVAEM